MSNVNMSNNVTLNIAEHEIKSAETNIVIRQNSGGSYEEPMRPWETDGEEYSFACCTEFNETEEQTEKIKKNKITKINATDKVNTVYHKKNSPYLIFKRQDKESQLDSGKKKSCGLFCCGGKRNSVLSEQQTIGTENVEISTIFNVERSVTQTTSQTKNTCCCSKKVETDSWGKYSNITIGFYRAFPSERINGIGNSYGEQMKFSYKTEAAYISIELNANQAWNLYQYINSILDGSHPQFSVATTAEI